MWKFDLDGDGDKDGQCDTCACGGGNCAGWIAQMMQVVDDGNLPADSMDGVTITCGDTGDLNCGKFDEASNTITINLADAGSSKCAGGTFFTLMHEVGHVLCAQQTGGCGLYENEMCENYACCVTGLPLCDPWDAIYGMPPH